MMPQLDKDNTLLFDIHGKVSTLLARQETLTEDMHRILKVLNGNGKPGLINQVHTLETEIEVLQKTVPIARINRLDERLTVIETSHTSEKGLWGFIGGVAAWAVATGLALWGLLRN